MLPLLLEASNGLSRSLYAAPSEILLAQEQAPQNPPAPLEAAPGTPSESPKPAAEDPKVPKENLAVPVPNNAPAPTPAVSPDHAPKAQETKADEPKPVPIEIPDIPPPEVQYQRSDEDLFRVEAGVSAIEEGDDRYRGGLHVALGLGAYSADMYYFSLKFGKVKTTTQVFALSRSFQIPGIEFMALSGRVGLAPLLETTNLNFDSEADQFFNRDEHQWNFGVLFGVFWEYPNSSLVRLRLAWDAALYPAGINGGILLATGRKHLLSLSVGLAL